MMVIIPLIRFNDVPLSCFNNNLVETFIIIIIPPICVQIEHLTTIVIVFILNIDF